MSQIIPRKKESTVSEIRKKVGDNVVLVAVSGGVDSSTTATLLNKEGIKTRCVFIDTGFMRKDEAHQAIKLLNKNNIDVEIIHAEDKFFSNLSGIRDPRQKRLVFKKTYFDIIENYLKDNQINFLAQGSQSKSDLLKRGYHNVCDNEYINKNIYKIEPLLGLSKVEIRDLAKELDLTKDLVEREPFPGPGLLIRFGGEYTQQKLDIIRRATEIVEKFKNKYPTEFKKCFQIFPYLCGENEVTFINKKNQTSLGHIILIRSVVLEDDIYQPFILPKPLFKELLDNLMQINDVARVCLDMTPKNGTIDSAKHGATIEYE